MVDAVDVYVLPAPRRRCVARERAVAFAPAPSPVEGRVGEIRERLAELAATDPTVEHDDDLGAAVLAVGKVASQLTAQETRLLRVFDDRGAYRRDACISTKGWLRLSSTLGPGAIKRRVQRAKLLQRSSAWAPGSPCP